MGTEGKEITENAGGVTGAEVVASEGQFRSRIAGLFVLSGALIFFGAVLVGIGNSPPLRFPGTNEIADLLYWGNHPGTTIGGGVVAATGYLLIVPPLTFLVRAAQNRQAPIPRIVPALVIAGGVLMAVSSVGLSVLAVVTSNKFSDHTGLSYAEADKLLKWKVFLPFSAAGLLGSFALAFSMLMTSLNAMRVGLLTRALGYTGILAGGLMVFRITPLPVVQLAWLVCTGAVIAGRWPGSPLAAWASGEARPWPTAAELRAAAADKKNNGKPA